MYTESEGWHFWVDRGGTFTDIVARRPDGTTVTHKLLSEHPRRYSDAAVQGIRDLLELADGDTLPTQLIDSVKMGTTVATNAMLERQGEPTLLVTTAGFADVLRIGYQTRPELFNLDIVLPEMLYVDVLEVDERLSAHGDVLMPLDEAAARAGLEAARARGIDAVAIVLMHGYRYHDHEARLGALAREIGYGQVSVSHEVSPLMKIVPRGDTSVVDAYLSPILGRYVAQVDERLRVDGGAPRLMFMQSNGGLTDAHRFKGKDALLSGPAGGVVGMARTAQAAGFDHIIGFDMGGTSTDVSHFAGELERCYETEIAGVRVRAPMIDIHTVAAGGGSILMFDGSRMRVGPESAGADPGPTCYGNDGPLAVTDCNVVLGKLRPEFFPNVFGPGGDEPLAVEATHAKFAELAAEIARATGVQQSVASIAEGFLSIAVENMANAIKKISVERGHDVTHYALACFGGAGGQHACLVADRLAIDQVHIHPLAGVLSALGIGLADIREVFIEAVEAVLTSDLLAELGPRWETMNRSGEKAMLDQGISPDRIDLIHRIGLRYTGSDTTLHVPAADMDSVIGSFEDIHLTRFGFISPEKDLIVESVQVEAIGVAEPIEIGRPSGSDGTAALLGHRATVMAGVEASTPFLDRARLAPGELIDGPAVLVEPNATTVIESGWQGQLLPAGDLVMRRVVARPERSAVGTTVDPVQLEIFNNLFMNIAQQMGAVLENTAVSVNIKERLDFSCAIFDPDGELIANAPHLPIHLGSMSEAIKSVIRNNPDMAEGDTFVLNAPYNGGTHLPDVTVVKPVFDEAGRRIFYVAARGHHADIGGTVPGSAPADSSSIEEEGLVLDNVKLVEQGRFLEADVRALLGSGPWPARNIDYNIADLKAQVAACERGAAELHRVIAHYGLDVVHAYMGHVMDNAEESVRRVIDALSDSEFVSEMDDGSKIAVKITVDHDNRSAVIDFTGTSPQHPGNLNAPTAVCRSAVLYVFRCMVDDAIPLNAGCLKPLEIVIPDPSMISPRYPAAVIAGNVETSQIIVDTLFGALGPVAGSQGTMNNFIWGNEEHQYYETICGGTGATPNHDGADAVHSHMTNTRLTDPEILEWRHPVHLEHFRIRRNSGGGGLHRGGDGVVRRLRFLEAMTVNTLSSSRRVKPFGVDGGGAGLPGVNRVIRTDGTETVVPGFARVEVEPGDMFEIETPGGGAYGAPAARPGDQQTPSGG